jgi:hypothetical protein
MPPNCRARAHEIHHLHKFTIEFTLKLVQILEISFSIHPALFITVNAAPSSSMLDETGFPEHVCRV